MNKKETTLGGCVGESVVLERSIEGDRTSKRCGVRNKVSSEDTDSSGSGVR
jgi:hypothetical protein